MQYNGCSLRSAGDLTDGKWVLLELLLSDQSHRGRKRRTKLRDVLEGDILRIAVGRRVASDPERVSVDKVPS